jgi:hypothetical protein
MKFLIALALLTASLFMVGCSTTSPLITPAALTSEVAQGVQAGLAFEPSVKPDIQLAQGKVCAAAQSTNTNPAMIVNDLQALGITNAYSVLIVNGAVLAYTTVYDLIGTNSTAVVEPYLTALCNGMTEGLASSTSAMQPKHRLLTPHAR